MRGGDISGLVTPNRPGSERELTEEENNPQDRQSMKLADSRREKRRSTAALQNGIDMLCSARRLRFGVRAVLRRSCPDSAHNRPLLAPNTRSKRDERNGNQQREKPVHH